MRRNTARRITPGAAGGGEKMKKTKIIIRQLEDLKKQSQEQQKKAEQTGQRIEAGACEKDIMSINYAINAIKENIIYKDILLKQEREINKIMVALFGTVRNSDILEQGLKEGKSMKEINALTIATLDKILNGGLINFENMCESYNQGLDEYKKIKQE